jgi:hypothetical protein
VDARGLTLMDIFAIDPGSTESALVVWNGERIVNAQKVTNGQMRTYLQVHVKTYGGIIAIEEIASYGMPVGRTVFQTVMWCGRFIEIASPYADVIMIPRLQVKLFLCGSAKAKDANIRQALLDKVGPQGTKKNPGPTYGVKADIWAALGVALTAEKLYKEPQMPWDEI